MKIRHVIIYAVFILAVLGLLYALSGNRAPRIPEDERHAVFDDVQLCRSATTPGEKPPSRRFTPARTGA
jgi:hypothetical protein